MPRKFPEISIFGIEPVSDFSPHERKAEIHRGLPFILPGQQGCFFSGKPLPLGQTYETMLKKRVETTPHMPVTRQSCELADSAALRSELLMIFEESFMQNAYDSTFIFDKVRQLLGRYALSYHKEGPCIEYFINRRFSTETISSDLIFSFSPSTKDLHVSRFYPELCHECNSKYLSAACFYLLIRHCANVYRLDELCHISLETIPSISERFYGKLKDFNFHVNKRCLGNVVELTSNLDRRSFDTSMIEKHAFREGEIPFLK